MILKTIAAAALLTSASAWATCPPGTTGVWPNCVAAGNSAQASAGAIAAAGANAGAGASTDADLTAQQRQGVQMDDHSSTRFSAWAIPAAPWLPPMAKVDCPSASVRQRSITTPGWGLFGTYQWSDTDASACEMLTVRNLMIERCRYASAAQVEDLLVQRTLPGFALVKPVDRAGQDAHYIDLTDQECALLKLPVKAEPAIPSTGPIGHDFRQAPVCEQPKAPPAKRHNRGKGNQPPATQPCMK